MRVKGGSVLSIKLDLLQPATSTSDKSRGWKIFSLSDRRRLSTGCARILSAAERARPRLLGTPLLLLKQKGSSPSAARPAANGQVLGNLIQPTLPALGQTPGTRRKSRGFRVSPWRGNGKPALQKLPKSLNSYNKLRGRVMPPEGRLNFLVSA
ncbi:retina and anterior neural fold homeobox protein [Striga asiatica]|uniref:Retina and anterior neural fold homeobox protein n=1 Tax=Striga asiatica TaxID=4170 RepID=A0A5A7NXV0_STRAF|nr:retina and anterior neural fold homeobox protein [Striga asiatica]